MTGLANINLSLFDQPEQPLVMVPKVDLPAILVLKRTQSGNRILLCTVTPTPAEAIAKAEAQNLPLFGLTEIPILKNCAAELLEKIILAKTTFPGATVTDLIKEVAA